MPISEPSDRLTPQGIDILEKASAALDGVAVRYATEYARDEASKSQVAANAMKGAARLAEEVVAAAIRAGSAQLSSGIPKSGWLIATDTNLCFHAKSLTGKIGASKGDIPIGFVHAMKIDHLKKGKKKVLITFADNSMVELNLNSAMTAVAGEAWAKWLVDNTHGEELPAEGPIFDMEVLFDQSSLGSH